ncbi:hypothetical protein DRN62_02350 [Nanoarchaeota archaeon]|nr:MAG: hypothetical protein DRN62_02350 [Nanoarchaeota archaeon]
MKEHFGIIKFFMRDYLAISMILEVGLLLFLILILYKSSEVLVESARIISAYFNVPEFFIGFLFIAFGTSLPELAVSVASSYFGHIDIAYGTVIGSNILDIALVLGLIIIFNRNIKIKSDLLLKDMIFTILISVIPLFLLFFNLPHLFLGLVLLSLFFVYLFKVMREKRFKKEIDVNAREAVKASLLIFPMLFLVIVASFLIPNLVEQVAMDLKIDDLLIAMTFVALGTSLPELMAGMSAKRKGYDYILWGDLTGSLVINATLVFGVSMLFSPFHVSSVLNLSSIAFLLTLEALLVLISLSERELKFSDGLAFVLAYVLYLALEFLINA